MSGKALTKYFNKSAIIGFEKFKQERIINRNIYFQQMINLFLDLLKNVFEENRKTIGTY